MKFKVGQKVKSKKTGTLYEIQSILPDGILLCYRLSHYDGMPVGDLVKVDPETVI
jgi:hypothetical protein